MLHVPRMVDMTARLVGIQVPRETERLYRKPLAGSQCAGNEALAVCRGGT
jgi:hypothetical protein